MGAKSRIVIVGHADLVRNGLEQILSRCPDFEIALSVEAPSDVIGPLRGTGVDADLPVIVFGPPGRGRAGVGAAIGALSRTGRVLVVGDFLEARQVTGAIRAGAFGCVPGHVDEVDLLLAVRAVTRGGVHISPALSPLLHSEVRGPENPAPAPLAPREIETVGWLALGLTHREIARRMGLTEATVSTYVKRIRTKLNARNKAELTRVAFELGLLDRDTPTVPDQRVAPASGADRRAALH